MKTTKEIAKEYNYTIGDTSDPQNYLDNLLEIESQKWYNEEELKPLIKLLVKRLTPDEVDAIDVCLRLRHLILESVKEK